MSNHPEDGKSSTGLLALGALGIVYGDIGTSPLYALKECFHGAHAIAATPDNVMGVLSLVFWSLTIVVAIKYLSFILRADNRGEGGIFALLALIPTGDGPGRRMRRLIIILAVFCAALLYGDGIITPAISVLSAVEGLGVATKISPTSIVLITCGILVVLFSVQHKGTAGIGRVFGPIMVIWFVCLASMGIAELIKNPSVLASVDPRHAVDFFVRNRMTGFVVLGSVVLCITGGEALYADMGHFGRKPIQLSWWALVFPALLLNYFGQGALLLSDASPATLANPFYAMVPEPLIYYMVVVATAATVIASQALISGAFSLTRQAIQLGYMPRINVIHTSDGTEGQIYVPFVNSVMAVACIALVLTFKSSSNLAAAYGLAVTNGMIITSLVYLAVVVYAWKWPLWKALPLVAMFLAFDLAYFGSNLLKFMDGGWLPITIGLLLLLVMVTWRDGRAAMKASLELRTLSFDLFLEDVKQKKPHRVPGTAVFMFSSPVGTSPVLLHHLKHNQVLHEQVVMLSILTAHVPFVPASEQLRVEELGEGFFRLTANFGYRESAQVRTIMTMATQLGLSTDAGKTSYFLGRETLLTTGPSRMWRWRKALFAVMAKNAQSPTAYFGLPPGGVIELGMQIDL